jgi:hypothetical protein
MGSLTDDSIGHILEFTTVADHRKNLRAYGFLVELDGEIGMFTFQPTTHMHAYSLHQDETPLRPSLLSNRSCEPILPTRTTPNNIFESVILQ